VGKSKTRENKADTEQAKKLSHHKLLKNRRIAHNNVVDFLLASANKAITAELKNRKLKAPRAFFETLRERIGASTLIIINMPWKNGFVKCQRT
jgi:hypothetical protein